MLVLFTGTYYFFSWTCAQMGDCGAPGGKDMNYIAATEILLPCPPRKDEISQLLI